MNLPPSSRTQNSLLCSDGTSGRKQENKQRQQNYRIAWAAATMIRDCLSAVQICTWTEENKGDRGKSQSNWGVVTRRLLSKISRQHSCVPRLQGAPSRAEPFCWNSMVLDHCWEIANVSSHREIFFFPFYQSIIKWNFQLAFLLIQEVNKLELWTQRGTPPAVPYHAELGNKRASEHGRADGPPAVAHATRELPQAKKPSPPVASLHLHGNPRPPVPAVSTRWQVVVVDFVVTSSEYCMPSLLLKGYTWSFQKSCWMEIQPW